MLVFILLVAAFNIVSTLSLMVIEKRSDMATMRALGAPLSMTRAIFVAEGWLITAVGGFVGLVFGIALSLLQQYGGIVKLAADPSALTIDVYPVGARMGRCRCCILCHSCYRTPDRTPLTTIYSSSVTRNFSLCRPFYFILLYSGRYILAGSALLWALTSCPTTAKFALSTAFIARPDTMPRVPALPGCPRDKKCLPTSRLNLPT